MHILSENEAFYSFALQSEDYSDRFQWNVLTSPKNSFDIIIPKRINIWLLDNTLTLRAAIKTLAFLLQNGPYKNEE